MRKWLMHKRDNHPFYDIVNVGRDTKWSLIEGIRFDDQISSSYFVLIFYFASSIRFTSSFELKVLKRLKCAFEAPFVQLTFWKTLIYLFLPIIIMSLFIGKTKKNFRCRCKYKSGDLDTYLFISEWLT